MERVDAGVGGGGCDKGHSRGRFPPPSVHHGRPFFFSLFLPYLRDRGTTVVSRRCRFDDSGILWVAPLSSRPRGALSRGPRNGMSCHAIFFDRSNFVGPCGSPRSVPSFSRSTRYTVLSCPEGEEGPFFCIPLRGYQLKRLMQQSAIFESFFERIFSFLFDFDNFLLDENWKEKFGRKNLNLKIKG